MSAAFFSGSCGGLLLKDQPLLRSVANMPAGELDRATEQLKMPYTCWNSGDISAARRLRCYCETPLGADSSDY